jgi:hypothetical protein
VQTLDKHFRELTKAAFARHGFAYGDLLAQWPAIIGEVAAMAVPEKIKWPKGAGDAARKLGGTLVLGAAPGRALELQYQVPFVIERVNGFLGHGAITAVKIVQGPVPVKVKMRAAPPVLSDAAAADLETRMAAISDDGLKAALRRLAAGALNPKRSPQPE